MRRGRHGMNERKHSGGNAAKGQDGQSTKERILQTALTDTAS